MLRSWKALLLCAPLVLVAACSDDDDNPPPGNGGNNPPPATGGLLGVEDNRLLQFSAAAPGTIQSEVVMSGFVEDDPTNPPFVQSIDLRPSTGVLTALTSDHRIYNVNTTTGVASQIGTLAVDPGVVVLAFNWDPVRDRIRAVGSNRENYDFNPDGTLAGRDSDLHYAAGDDHANDVPSIEGISYVGGAGATTTTLYGIDGTIDSVVTIGTANDPTSQDSGEVHTVHELSQPVGGSGSLPFAVETTGTNPAAYLTDSTGTETHLFRVNLVDGTLTDLGEVGVDRRIHALTIAGSAGGGNNNGGGNPPPPPTGGVGGDEICSTQITGVGATAQVQPNDPQCIGCVVYNPSFAIDGDPESFATYDLQLGVLLGGVGVRFHAPAGVVYPAGRIAGGVFNFPGADLLSVAVAPDLTISTFLGDEAQDSTTLGGDTVVLDIAHSVVADDRFFAGLTTTQPFDAIEIKPDIGLVGAFTRLNLFSACAGSVDEGTFP